MHRFVLLAALAPSLALATPIQLSHQLRTSNALGAPIDGTIELEIRLYDGPTGEGLLHDETFSTLPVNSGYASVVLGADTLNDPLHHTVFDNGPVWLEQWVDSERLGERQQLVYAPYAAVALNAASAGGLGTNPTNAASSCLAIRDSDPNLPSGSYWLDVTGSANGYSDAFEAYCDMDTDGGGWTLVSQGIPQPHPALNLCTSAAVGSLDRSQYQVPGPAKLSDATIQALWDAGTEHKLMAIQHVGNWTTNQVHVDYQCILDFKSTWAWDVSAGGTPAELTDLDNTTPQCLVGSLNGDGVLDSSAPNASTCGFYLYDSAGASSSYFIYSAVPTYTSACGSTTNFTTGRSWMGSVGNNGCNVTKHFVR